MINDLSTDQRVDRVCNSLLRLGFDVILVGRKQHKSIPLSARDYRTHRMNLLFEKGPLFYMEYTIRLFFFLLFHRADVLVSNDLDTLLPNYLISVFKRKPLMYDSHEYFTEVPELQNSGWKKNTWKGIERFIFPKLKYVFTVNESIAKLYKDEYNKEIVVIRNVPVTRKDTNWKTKEELKLPLDKKIVLLQGAGINVDRGGEEAVQAMQYVSDAVLLIIGNGDVVAQLKEMVVNLRISDKVKFIDRLPFEELIQYTRHADIGLTLDKDTNINYRDSLPNKMFDYIHSGVPVLASSLVEVKKIVVQYNIGELIESHQPQHIAEKMNEMLNNAEKMKMWKENAKIAAENLCWEKEEKELIKVYSLFV